MRLDGVFSSCCQICDGVAATIILRSIVVTSSGNGIVCSNPPSTNGSAAKHVNVLFGQFLRLHIHPMTRPPIAPKKTNIPMMTITQIGPGKCQSLKIAQTAPASQVSVHPTLGLQ